MFSPVRKTLGQNIWEIHEAKTANPDDIISTYFAKTGHVTRI